MGQHKSNQNAEAVKRGELSAKPKAEKPPTKKEESFLTQWTRVIARRPEPPTEDHKCARGVYRARRRQEAAEQKREQQIAKTVIRQRMKAARRAA